LPQPPKIPNFEHSYILHAITNAEELHVITGLKFELFRIKVNGFAQWLIKKAIQEDSSLLLAFSEKNGVFFLFIFAKDSYFLL